MKILAVIGSLLFSASTFAFPQDTMCEDRYPNLCSGTTTYQCSGKRVSGTIRITPRDRVTRKGGGSGIAFQVASHLMVDGRAYSLRGSSEVKYKRRYLDGYGTWEPNYDVWLYNLLAARARFNPRHIPMYLEVRYGGSGGIDGYLAYHDSSTPNDPSFNFKCRIR